MEGVAANQARLSVIWNAGFGVFRYLVQFLQMLVLARLVSASEYGQSAVITSLIGFLAIFSFKPFVAYSLQPRDDSDVEFQHHFTAGAVLQVLMFFICNLVAIGVRWTGKYQSLALPIHLMSVLFLLELPTELRQKMLERAFDWKRRRLLHAVGLIVSTAVALGMAVAGAGVYALLLPSMAVALPFIWDLFVVEKWRPTFAFCWEDYREATRFGLARIGSGLATQGRAFLEASMLAGIFGFAALGTFNRAVGLAQLACYTIAFQLMYAVYPILTRMDTGSGQLRRAGDMLIRTITWIALPGSVLLALVADPLVHVLYGAAWTAVIPLMKWTLGLSVLLALVSTCYFLLLALNASQLCLICDVVVLAGTTLNLLVARWYGVVPYLAGQAALQVVVLVPLARVLLTKSSLSWRGVAVAIVPAAVCSAVAALPLLFMPRAGHNPMLQLVVQSGVFCAIYVIALRLAFPSNLREIVLLLPGGTGIARNLRLG
jgi:O-antigen/teichoic acid export membrane protein